MWLAELLPLVSRTSIAAVKLCPSSGRNVHVFVSLERPILGFARRYNHNRNVSYYVFHTAWTIWGVSDLRPTQHIFIVSSFYFVSSVPTFV